MVFLEEGGKCVQVKRLGCGIIHLYRRLIWHEIQMFTLTRAWLSLQTTHRLLPDGTLKFKVHFKKNHKAGGAHKDDLEIEFKHIFCT